MAVEYVNYQGFNCVKLSFNNCIAQIMYGRGCNVIELKDTQEDLSLLHFRKLAKKKNFPVLHNALEVPFSFHQTKCRMALLP